MEAVLSRQAATAEAIGRFQDSSTGVGLVTGSPSTRIRPQADNVVLKSPSQAGDTLNDVIQDTTRRNKLINDNNLLKGIIMGRDGPVPSSRELIVRPDTLRAIINNRATIETTTVEAEFTETLMESNYNSASVKVSAPFITANSEYSESSSFKNTETEKSMYTSSRYLFPQGRIDFTTPDSGFEDVIKLSPQFTSGVQAALAKATGTEKREALQNLFQEYGHVFRTKVQIGGVLSAHTMETFSRSENETEVKQDVKAGLEGAVKGWGGGATAGHGNTQGTITTSQNRKLNVKYIVNGGDYTKIQNTEEWVASTNQSEHWRVIEVTEVTAVADLLPQPIRGQVKDFLKPLLGKWVDVEKVPGLESLPVSVYRPKGAIPAGWFWLGDTADASKALLVKPTLPARSGRNPALTSLHEGPGMTEQPFVDLPQYQYLSTYFGNFVQETPPGSTLRGLRPDHILPGRYEMHGDTISTAVYVTRPVDVPFPEDECFDLKSLVRVKLPGSDNPPKPRWALKKSMVLFDSGEK
ncbi:pleurotolysin B precursor [Pleurotus ostreatus PC15]|uniref:Pleurotolysin B n=1 Tax=Pleurotus ostreatus (strain PC15) TaxID=1137138 RepID=A0A067NP23_PLEO1|nr:pleurotolysin B precursor [Pleurotus ostreatus PC15]